MRRFIAVAAAAISLAGCSSFSTPDYLTLDYYKSKPVTVQLQLESTPPGAEARTSIGAGCKTPCSVSVTPPDGVTSFLVNYSLPGRQPAGVPVNVTRTDGGMFSSGTLKLDPNPVMAELQPVGPSPTAHKPSPRRKKPSEAAASDGSAAPGGGQAAAPQR